MILKIARFEVRPEEREFAEKAMAEKLLAKVNELEDENASLREYVDKLMRDLTEFRMAASD